MVSFLSVYRFYESENKEASKYSKFFDDMILTVNTYKLLYLPQKLQVLLST